MDNDQIPSSKEGNLFEGKKVFFVAPHDIVREHIIDILSENEYEVYILNNQGNLNKVLERYPGSIIYVNIDGTQSEHEWKKNITDLRRIHDGLQIGVLSGRLLDKPLLNFYIMDVGVTCGIIQLRQGIHECSDTMLKVLEANEARGRRKFLRYSCRRLNNVNLNFRRQNSHIEGNIIDISSVGLTCSFEQPMELSKGQLIKEVQLKLYGIIMMTDCVVMGHRDEEGVPIFVLLFRFPPNSMVQRKKVRNFIHSSLQKELDNSL